MEKLNITQMIHWATFILISLFGPVNKYIWYLLASIALEAITIGLKYFSNKTPEKFNFKKFSIGLISKIAAYLVIVIFSNIFDQIFGRDNSKVRDTVCIALIAFDCFGSLTNLAAAGFVSEVNFLKRVFSGIKGVAGEVFKENGKEDTNGKDDQT